LRQTASINTGVVPHGIWPSADGNQLFIGSSTAGFSESIYVFHFLIHWDIVACLAYGYIKVSMIKHEPGTY
jgi:hypothetical protein